MKPEFSVEPDMLGALRKGEEAGVADTPAFEGIAGGGDEPLADAGIPEVGPDR